jgi:hypothetical protein
MTVNELIEQLKNYPSDMIVVIPGYEGGFDNPVISTNSAIFDTNWDGQNKQTWYNGRHDLDYDRNQTNGKPNVVVVGR